MRKKGLLKLWVVVLFMSISGTGLADPIVLDPGYTITQVATGLGAATGIAIAPSGDIFLTNYSDTGPSKILRVDRITYSVQEYATGLYYSAGIAIDSSGRIFATSSSSNVYEIFSDGSKSLFSTGYSFPVDLTFGKDSYLYISNSGDGTISRIDSSGTGTTYLSGLGGPDGPFGFDFDNSGNVYVVQHGNGNIWKVAPDQSKNLIADLPDFGPTFLTLNGSGAIYVSDSLNAMIWKIDGGVVSVFASGFTGKSTPPSIGPDGLAFDSSGNLYVADANSLWKISPIATAPKLSCVGFENPMNNGPVIVKKNRVLPLRAQLLDSSGAYVTGADITPPVLQVLLGGNTGGEVPTDVTSQSLPTGQGTEGNQFVFTSDGKWQFNLMTKNYSAPGTYTISILTGDNLEYVINPSCTATFVIE